MAYPKLTDEPGLAETAAAIAQGAMSAAEAVDAAIARIEELDGPVNAVVVPDFERAAATAKAMDAALASGDRPGPLRPLYGVPMTVKESFDVEGLQSCWGHGKCTDTIAPRDSELVRRLKAAGAIILGKTNVPVDLSDWQSFNPVYGRTKNPHDTARSPGGSSGGSAAAVAAGMVPGEYGTDIGGSVRVPAHFCGVWGHKTTWGIVSKHGHDHPIMARRAGFVAAHDGALSIAGPLTRNAQDLATLTAIGSKYPLRQSGKPLKDCRLLAITDYPGAPVDASVAEPTEAALAALSEAGVNIDRSSDLVPDLESQQAAYMRMLNTAMARGAPGPNGKRATATDWFDLLDAQAAKEVEWARLFEVYDFVLAPPAPVLAVPHMDADTRVFDSTIPINGADVPGAAGLAWAGIATFPNLPSTVLPIGSGIYQGAELPCGMQVMGPSMADLDCIAAAEQIGIILHG
ncbi:MAG: amidase family protein [Pseudomonadota bacterium]